MKKQKALINFLLLPRREEYMCLVDCCWFKTRLMPHSGVCASQPVSFCLGLFPNSGQ